MRSTSPALMFVIAFSFVVQKSVAQDEMEGMKKDPSAEIGKKREIKSHMETALRAVVTTALNIVIDAAKESAMESKNGTALEIAKEMALQAIMEMARKSVEMTNSLDLEAEMMPKKNILRIIDGNKCFCNCSVAVQPKEEEAAPINEWLKVLMVLLFIGLIVCIARCIKYNS